MKFVEKIESLNESMRVEIDEAKEGSKSWIDHESLRRSRLEKIPTNEALFFEQLIEKYLSPNLDGGSDPQKIMADKAKAIENLRDLRNNVAYCYLILNGFWLLIMFTLNLLKPKMVDKIYFNLRFDYSKTPKDTDKAEPVSFCYVILFAVVLILQFGAMVWHRVITLTQVIRKTSLLDSHKKTNLTAIPVVRREQNGHINNQFEGGSENKSQERRETIITL